MKRYLVMAAVAAAVVWAYNNVDAVEDLLS